jgi:CheY-like chemotaxis protein
MENNDSIIDMWKILIIDDNVSIHTITKNALWDEKIHNKDIDFMSAYSEEEAITILNNFHKDIVVVILDMVLGDKGYEGHNIIKHIYDELKNEYIQIIIRTGYYNRQEVKEIEMKYPQVFILEKGETDVNLLNYIITEAITKYLNIKKTW